MAGAIYLGGPAEFLSTMIVPKLTSVLAAGIRVRTRFDLAQRLVKDLAEGTLDIAICTLRVRSAAIGYAPLYREEFVLVGSRALGSKLSRRLSAATALERLRGEAVLAYSEDLPIVRRYWREVFDADADRQAALVLPDLRGIITAVAEGVGISVVPRYLCEPLIATGDLVVLVESVASPFNDIQLAWNRYALRHPRVAYLRDHILGAFPPRQR